jgi:hypothetical protein
VGVGGAVVVGETVAVVVGPVGGGAEVEVFELDDIGGLCGCDCVLVLRVSAVRVVVVRRTGWRYTGGGVDGNVPAIVPGIVEVAVGAPVFGSVKFVVVSTDVLVIGGVIIGCGVSPGAAIVEVAPLAEPSCTTSYCC